ncbi:MAG: SHOCT domain-containing protein [Clostridia bacterium]|nr:SHOCT domain-containing protein [Clostridia bacterium]
MEEKIIVESKSYAKTIRILASLVCLAVMLLGVVMWAGNYNNTRKRIDKEYDYFRYRGYSYYNGTRDREINYSFSDNIIHGYDPVRFPAGFTFDFGLLLLIGSVIFIWKTSAYKMTVTDKRIYGKTSFGRRVDLPLDSISAVGVGAFRSIAVATSSGKIKFGFIENRDEIHTVIGNLLVQRQNRPQQTAPVPPAPAAQPVSQSAADELKKYKDLLDSGVITQDEFDAKKKQLLGL